MGFSEWEGFGFACFPHMGSEEWEERCREHELYASVACLALAISAQADHTGWELGLSAWSHLI